MIVTLTEDGKLPIKTVVVLTVNCVNTEVVIFETNIVVKNDTWVPPERPVPSLKSVNNEGLVVIEWSKPMQTEFL